MNKTIRVRPHFRRGRIVRTHLRTWRVSMLVPGYRPDMPESHVERVELGPKSNAFDVVQEIKRRGINGEIIGIADETDVEE